MIYTDLYTAKMGTRTKPPLRRPASVRERIDQTAYELFSRHGIRATGVDTLAARAGVAKMTLYKHYPSKEALALAFLPPPEELWTPSRLHHDKNPPHPPPPPK